MTQGSGEVSIRTASLDDAEKVAVLVNAAYRVEAFFKIGDRTSPDEVVNLMRSGRFLLLDIGGQLAGAVYVETKGPLGYFGMLSIDPSRQHQGLGARLVNAAEEACRSAGCTTMELLVVNLRVELPAYYRRFGYVEQGTRAFSDPEQATMACHCIVMSKTL
jgi:GNAT superfamily N-acetyltransferase